MSKRPRIAQVGVGYWGPNLLRNLSASSDCELAAVVEMSAERQEFVKARYPGIPVFDSVDEIFDDPSVDAVVLATPAETHFDLGRRALESGKHILVEKPMAQTVEEVETLGSLARERALIAMVGHTFLYNNAVRYVKGLVDSGELGEIRYIYSKRLNLGRIRGDVDALWNLAPHDISIIQYLLGDPEPTKITRVGMDYIQPGIDDVVFLTIEYPDRVLANVHVSWLDPHKTRLLTVVGSKKMVVYDDTADNKIAIYDKGIDRMAVLGEEMDFDEGRAPSFVHRSGDLVYPVIPGGEPLAVEIAHFIECIGSGEEPLTGTSHAARVVQILADSVSPRAERGTSGTN